MALKGPKGAEPTLRGWINPKTGELLKSQRMTQAQVDEWHGVKPEPKPEPAPVEVPEEASADYNEDGVIDELESMSKAELELLGREHGVELDRRLRKASLIGQLRGIISSK